MKILYFIFGSERSVPIAYEKGKSVYSIDSLEELIRKVYPKVELDIVADFYTLDDFLREHKNKRRYDKIIMNILKINTDVQLYEAEDANLFFRNEGIEVDDILGNEMDYSLTYLTKVMIPQELIDPNNVLIRSIFHRGEFKAKCPELFSKSNIHYLDMTDGNRLDCLKTFLNHRDRPL